MEQSRGENLLRSLLKKTPSPEREKVLEAKFDVIWLNFGITSFTRVKASTSTSKYYIFGTLRKVVGLAQFVSQGPSLTT